MLMISLVTALVVSATPSSEYIALRHIDAEHFALEFWGSSPDVLPAELLTILEGTDDTLVTTYQADDSVMISFTLGAQELVSMTAAAPDAPVRTSILFKGAAASLLLGRMKDTGLFNRGVARSLSGRIQCFTTPADQASCLVRG